MPDFDPSGIVALSDAGIREAQSQADVINKLAQAELTHQQAQHQAILNLAKMLNLEWDAQAHSNLLRMRNIALQRARLMQHEAERLRLAVGRFNALLVGGSWEAIRDGWIAFDTIQRALAFAAVKAMGDALPNLDAAAYKQDAWIHPTNRPYESTSSAISDPSSLIAWARRTTLYPKVGGSAWKFLAAYAGGLAQAAGEKAAEIKTRLDEADKYARELQERDWDRLKESSKAANEEKA